MTMRTIRTPPPRHPTLSRDESFLLSSYNYHLPPELIAQEPTHPRDSSRLMVCDLNRNELKHLRFHGIGNVLEKGDILVLNDSRVIPARVRGRKPTGGKTEVLFLNTGDGKGPLEALIKGKVQEGTFIIPDMRDGRCHNGQGMETREDNCHNEQGMETRETPLRIEVTRHISEGRFEVDVKGVDDVEGFLDRHGEMPVPPYIRKPLEDREDYQTVYSRESGSIAAPTAGLHFTTDLLAGLRKQGVRIVTVTLHVGIGTFLPVRDNDIRNHVMEPEYFVLGDEVRDILASEGSEVIGVGTTVVKTLESVFAGTMTGKQGTLRKGTLRTEGWSDLFIYPGHSFRSPLKGMFTNFHLPGSSLIMLVSAYAGRDRIMQYYQEAVRERYRFYSFGDAMFLKGRPG